MAYALGPGLSYGFHGERAIMLDLVRDRYRLLDRRLSAALTLLARDGRAPEDAMASLVRQGIIAVPPGDPIEPVSLARPVESMLDAPLSAASTSPGVIGIAASLVRTRLDLSTRTLFENVTRLRALRRRARCDGRMPEAMDIARTFARLRSRIPLDPACMLESFALSRLLCARGLAHDLVFGVRLEPFAAHAWVQIPTHVLTDRVDRIAEFVPVFRL